MSEGVHVDAPHELTETSEKTSGRERMLELVAVLLLSFSTLGIAWSGYQAARWNGIQARHYAEANTARSLASRATTIAGQGRLQDLLNFNRWLEVSTQGDQELANLYVRRFRPEFVPAFDAWLAQDPIHNLSAAASPLLMPQYKPADVTRANRLDQTANSRFTEAKDATEHGDSYILATVFFGAVLFFAGISLRFEWTKARIVVLSFGAGFLIYGFVHLASLPIG